MENQNPYETPRAELDNPTTITSWDTSPFYSLSGRFGRAAYITYNLALWVTFMVLASALAGIAIQGMLPPSLFIVLYLPAMFLGIVFGIRRLHDMNWSGWAMLLIFVPLANLILYIALLFVKGTDGPNDFGPPRQYVKAHGYIAAITMVLVLTGIVTATVFTPFMGQ